MTTQTLRLPTVSESKGQFVIGEPKRLLIAAREGGGSRASTWPRERCPPASATAGKADVDAVQSAWRVPIWKLADLMEANLPETGARGRPSTGRVERRCRRRGDGCAALTRHPWVNKVIFTGTTEMGRTIVRQSTENFQRITLELGVKSPSIVFPGGRLSGSRQRRHDRHLLQPG